MYFFLPYRFFLYICSALIYNNDTMRQLGTVLVLTLLCLTAQSQQFTDINLPSSICGGTSKVITIGFNRSADVVVKAPLSTLSHPGVVFLPDGVPCNENGCSYRSPLTFTAFDDTTVIRNADDIRYVRLNIEHSFIHDIYINITCPNGQKADILRFGGNNNSACQHAIPDTAVGWRQGENIDGEVFLGWANDSENTADACSPTALGNEPGVGWNYCWSNSSDYQYAEGGYIYRIGHTVATAIGAIVDSSSAAHGTGFYEPDDHFESLVGCPMNGTWYIEVVDGFSIDNGYIFDWELALNPELLPNQCTLTERYMKGPYVQRLTDSTFSLQVPSSLAHDTVITYSFGLVNSCGDTVDTAMSIILRPAFNSVVDLSGCDTVWFGNIAFTQDTTVYRNLHTAAGCDSNQTVSINIKGSHLRAQAAISPMVVEADGQAVELHDMSIGAEERLWLIGGIEYTDKDITYAYPGGADSIEAVLIAYSRDGCTDTLTNWLQIDRSVVAAPNIFTPTRESNSRWHLGLRDIESAEVWIYDRNGMLVYHCEGIDCTWDGTDPSGQPCVQGVYVFNATYTTRTHPGRKQRLTDTIALVR